MPCASASTGTRSSVSCTRRVKRDPHHTQLRLP
jgi:hypothetical protein